MDCRMKAVKNDDIETIADSYYDVYIHTESDSIIKESLLGLRK